MSWLVAYFVIGMMISGYMAVLPGIAMMSPEERNALMVTSLFMWPLIIISFVSKD